MVIGYTPWTMGRIGDSVTGYTPCIVDMVSPSMAEVVMAGILPMFGLLWRDRSSRWKRTFLNFSSFQQKRQKVSKVSKPIT